MKNQLLFAIAICAILVSGCSKGSDNDEPLTSTYWGQTVDSVIKATNIKVQDPNNLTINNYFLKDKEESIYLFGNRGVKFWMGVYSKTGLQYFDKTFTEDPETVYSGFNNTLKLTTTSVYGVAQTENSLYILRRIFPESNSAEASVEAITKYNISQKSETTKYSDITSGKAVFRILPWIDKTVLFASGSNSEALIELKDENDNVLEKYTIPQGKSNYIPIEGDIPASRSEFIRTGTTVSKLSILGQTKWTLNLMPELTTDIRVYMKSKKLSGDILTLEFEAITFAGQKSQKIYKIDIITGKLI